MSKVRETVNVELLTKFSNMQHPDEKNIVLVGVPEFDDAELLQNKIVLVASNQTGEDGLLVGKVISVGGTLDTAEYKITEMLDNADPLVRTLYSRLLSGGVNVG